jgi:hypothetical protein
LVVAIIIAIGAAFALDQLDFSSADTYSRAGNVRL